MKAPSFCGSFILVAPPVGENLIDGPEYFFGAASDSGGVVDFSLNPEARNRVKALLPGDDDAMRVRNRIMVSGCPFNSKLTASSSDRSKSHSSVCFTLELFRLKIEELNS